MKPIKLPNLPFLKRKSRRKVGLDIGNYNLKVVEIGKKENSLEIVNMGIKDIRENKDIPKAIEELFEETHISSKEISISLSGENVAARYLSLPKMTEDELRKAMAYELEDRIPFKAEEVYTDYYTLEDDAGSKNNMRVFLVAAKKELLDSRLNLVRQAGLEPNIITMDTLAIKNTFYFNYPAKKQTNAALLNIGDKITNLLIVRGEIPYFVRDTRFGGDAITSLIQTKLGLNKEDAEAMKYNLKSAPPDVSQIIKSTLSNLLSEIFVSLDFYENLTEQRIDEVYISGGSSQLSGFTEFLGGYLGMNIFTLDPFKNFFISNSIPKEKIEKFSPYLTVAVGLALENP